MINIRRGILEDEPAIFQLFRQLLSNPAVLEYGHDTFHRIMNDENFGTILVAEKGDHILGLITLSYPWAVRCGGIYSCVEEFVVSEKFRGQGIGGQLIQAAIKEATLRGCYEIQINNPTKIGYPIYLEHGFEDTGKHLKMSLRQIH